MPRRARVHLDGVPLNIVQRGHNRCCATALVRPLRLPRLREINPEHLVYESVKRGPGGSLNLMLTPLELLDRLAALIPPPRRHRHRYFGVLAPNSPLRAAVTALAGLRAETPAAQTPAAAPGAPPPPLRAHQTRRHKPQKSRSIAGRRARPGRCCLPASMRYFRC